MLATLVADDTMRGMIASLLRHAAADLSTLLERADALAPQLEALSVALIRCWEKRGKVLIAGNGGSAAEAMHFAEELVVRFRKNRRALAAIALTDPTVLTCAGNDFGYESVFERQVEALGNEGDVFIALTTSGNSPNLIRAIKKAREQKLVTCAFLGRDGGQARGLCDIELIVPSDDTARIQEIHQLLFHTLCQWLDEQYAGQQVKR